MPDLLNIEHTIDTLNKQTIPLIQQTLAAGTANAEKALAQLIDRAAMEIGNLTGGLAVTLQNTLDSLPPKLQALLDKQDGWTLTITIPPITIRLAKPLEPKTE